MKEKVKENKFSCTFPVKNLFSNGQITSDNMYSNLYGCCIREHIRYTYIYMC